MPPGQRVLRFPPTLAGFQAAGRALTSILESRDLDGGARHNVQLVFEEIATNIVRHGSASGDVEVGITLDDHEVVLTFEDDGKPFDPRTQPEPPAPSSLDDARIGGLGLVLVRKFSTRIDYERTPQSLNRLTVAIPVR